MDAKQIEYLLNLLAEIASALDRQNENDQERNLLMAQQIELWRGIIKAYDDGDNSLKLKFN